jgi:hypothetical protein
VNGSGSVTERDGGGSAAPPPAAPMQLVAEVGTTLALEAQRYLAVVEFFRHQGCEPHWRPEPWTVAHGPGSDDE